ncbi:hypothetical protein GGX14DRAFT_508091 [Mycena pura]|uniref:HAUS augmin-like complex subunit 6 N-terminal domain-containing protein n=1 Tax=Mycena pura TaxID=153505 RepID=A0AAD7E5N8_9AGAR|nr:hypothetical protein GGX14DRAFT_508091 [Mycena pura]
MPTMASVYSLPMPLILLVHLHILQYPHENKPEYDHEIFDAHVRGLRERTKVMEDICYFLVSRIEGKDKARKTIPIYPCSRPADTTIFRASLAKYLENLRHSSIAPIQKGRADAQVGGSSGAGNAWWWTDVVVRKSLLEECTGERFERLMLAFSTHALLKGSAVNLEPHETPSCLRDQPRIYVTRLAAFQSSQNSWARAASLLDQRQHDLQVLRGNLSCYEDSQKYRSLSTERLLRLAESKLQDLLTERWAGSDGPGALKFFLESAGITKLGSLEVFCPRSAKDIRDSTYGPTVLTSPPSPLPIAAAQHPTALRKLGKRILYKDAIGTMALCNVSPAPPSPQAHATLAFSGLLDSEARMLQALTDTVARTRKASTVLRARVARHTSTQLSTYMANAKTSLRSPGVDLWQDTQHISVDFAAKLTDSSFVSLGLSPPSSEKSIEARIQEVREALRPAYSSAPTTEQPSAPLSQPAAKRSPPHTPRARLRDDSSQTVRPATRIQPAERTRKQQHIPRLEKRLPSAHRSNRSPVRSSTSQSESQVESDPEPVGAATPRAHAKHALKQVALRELSDPALHSDEELAEDPFIEGPSLSVRDLLLQADTTHFDIIGDESNDLFNQSFGWA